MLPPAQEAQPPAEQPVASSAPSEGSNAGEADVAELQRRLADERQSSAALMGAPAAGPCPAGHSPCLRHCQLLAPLALSRAGHVKVHAYGACQAPQLKSKPGGGVRPRAGKLQRMEQERRGFVDELSELRPRLEAADARQAALEEELARTQGQAAAAAASSEQRLQVGAWPALDVLLSHDSGHCSLCGPGPRRSPLTRQSRMGWHPRRVRRAAQELRQRIQGSQANQTQVMQRAADIVSGAEDRAGAAERRADKAEARAAKAETDCREALAEAKRAAADVKVRLLCSASEQLLCQTRDGAGLAGCAAGHAPDPAELQAKEKERAAAAQKASNAEAALADAARSASAKVPGHSTASVGNAQLLLSIGQHVCPWHPAAAPDSYAQTGRQLRAALRAAEGRSVGRRLRRARSRSCIGSCRMLRAAGAARWAP